MDNGIKKKKKEGKRGPKAEEDNLAPPQADETKATELCIPPPDKMLIFVKEGEDVLVTLEVKPSDTIGDVKAKVHPNIETPPDRQILVFDWCILEDERTLADYNIKHLSTLLMVVQIEAVPWLRGQVPVRHPHSDLTK